MAFPVVETTATTNGTSTSSSPIVNLPSGIVSGNLLFILFRTSIGTAGIGWPSGYTELVESSADASDDAQAVAYRKADGTEGATITLSTSSARFAAIAYRISGAADPATQPPQVSVETSATNTTPDPSVLSPTGGAKDYLWFWLGGWEGEQTSPPAGSPTNYSNPLGADSGTIGSLASNCRVASAQRNLNASSENPGIWTISASGSWIAWIAAVHPVAGATTNQTLTASLIASAASMVRSHVRTLSTSLVTSTASLLFILTFVRTLVASFVVSTASLLTTSTFLKTLAASSVTSTTSLFTALTALRTLTATLGQGGTSTASLTRSLIFAQTLSATLVASTSTTLRMFTAVRTLTASLITSTVSMLRTAFISFTTTPVTSIASMFRESLRTLTTSLVTSIASMTQGFSFARTLTASLITSVVSMLRSTNFSRVLTTTIVASTGEMIRTTLKLLGASLVASITNMSRIATFTQTLTTSLVASTATLLRILTALRTLTATLGVSSTSMLTAFTAVQTLTANVVASIASITRSISFARTLTANAVTSIATLIASGAMTFARTLTANAVTSAASVLHGMEFLRTLTTPAILSTASLLRGLSIQRTLSALSTVLATFTRHRSYGLPFLYTAANWGGTPSFYLEVSMRASIGMAQARVYNETDAVAVANSEVTTTSTTYVHLRSSAIVLENNKRYSVQFGVQGDDSGRFKGAKLVVTPGA